MRHKGFGATIVVLCLMLLMVSGCGAAADPTEVTSGQDPIPPERSVQTWWRQLTNTSGFVEGRITYTDGRPLARAGIACRAHTANQGSTDLGLTTDDDGHYHCGSAPGVMVLDVYDPVVGGLLVSQEVEIKARQTIRLDLVVEPPQPSATPTATKNPG